jgi:hypothetical protein
LAPTLPSPASGGGEEMQAPAGGGDEGLVPSRIGGEY